MMRPISSNMARRSARLMTPSRSLSMIWKPSLNSATCFWENMSKTLLPDFLAFFDELETVLELSNLLLGEHVEDIASGLLGLLRGAFFGAHDAFSEKSDDGSATQ